MPRTRGNRFNPDPVEAIPFKFFTFLTITSTSLAAPTVLVFNLTPAFDDRLSSIAQAFQFYRFKNFKVHLLPTKIAAEVNGSVGYLPRIANTPPTTHNELLNMPGSAMKSYSQTVKSTMNLKPNILLGDSPLKWFQTAPGTEDSQWEVQGVLYFAGTATANPSDMLSVWEGVCEFKGRTNRAQAPLLRQPIKANDPLENNRVNSSERKAKKDESAAVVIGGVTYLRSEA